MIGFHSFNGLPIRSEVAAVVMVYRGWIQTVTIAALYTNGGINLLLGGLCDPPFQKIVLGKLISDTRNRLYRPLHEILLGKRVQWASDHWSFPAFCLHVFSGFVLVVFAAGIYHRSIGLLPC